MMAGEEGTGRYVSGWHRGEIGEIEKLVAYTPVHINGNIWSVAVCAPVCEVEEMIGETKRSGQVILGLVILILILGGGSLFVVSYHWSHVLEQEVAERTKEVRETRDYLINLIQHANAPIIVWNPDKRVTMFNEAFERMSGRTEAEMKEQPLGALFLEESRADSLKNIEKTSKGEHWETVEIPILNKDGETRMALWNSANIYGEDGKTLMATIAQGLDITERVRAEERIERLNSVLKAIRNVNQLIVSETDRDRLLQKACDVLLEARGYETAWIGFSAGGTSFTAVKGAGFGENVAFLGERLMDGDHPPCIENALDPKAPPLMLVDKSEVCGDCFFKEACAAREVAIVRVEHADRLFGLLAVSLASDTVVDDEEKGLLIEAAGDIGLALHGMELEEARGKAEEELRESEEKYRQIFDGTSEGIYRTTPDGQILVINRALVEMLGYDSVEEVMEINIQTEGYQVPADRHKFIELMEKDGQVRGFEAKWRRRDGTVLFVRENAHAVRDEEGKSLYFEGTIEDITERKHLEEQLRQAQKMEAIGTLTGGVAHDFNNILTALQGNTELASMKVREDDPVARNLSEIRKGIERAARLTYQLLLFSRQQPMEMTILNLNGMVDELTKMLKRLIGEHISLTTKLAPGLWKVKGDFGTIEQVIMNLVVNARDAMPKGGTVSVRTRNVEVDEVFCSACEEARPGRFVCLSVRDSGVGIDPNIMDRIFDPFFTTKGLGVGTGLGLSVVYGIVKQHEGWITVDSAPGNGALFEVYLPAVSIEPEEKPQNATVSLEAFRGSGERILVVEDDEIIRELSAEMLSESGYAAFAAANAREALELFEKEGGNFDLLFCDVVLPDGRGPELSEQLLKRTPGLRVLFTSGYMNEESDWQAIQERGDPFLQKPYSPSDFLRAVRDALKNH